MAETPEQVKNLFGDISKKARPKAEAELREIKEYYSLKSLNAWDSSYYSRKLREEKYVLDEKELKKYFVFENVRAALFETVKRLYNLELKKIELPLYTTEAELYEVYKDGIFVSYFYTDYFYTPLKRQGAWADIQREVFENKKKIVVNVCNFQKNTD
jgi:Zn-dependent oligopeptidase